MSISPDEAIHLLKEGIDVSPQMPLKTRIEIKNGGD